MKSWIESTAPNELIEMPGSSASASAWRANSIDDGRATSISPATSRRVELRRRAVDDLGLVPQPRQLLLEVAVEREAVDELDAADARGAGAGVSAHAGSSS